MVWRRGSSKKRCCFRFSLLGESNGFIYLLLMYSPTRSSKEFFQVQPWARSRSSRWRYVLVFEFYTFLLSGNSCGSAYRTNNAKCELLKLVRSDTVIFLVFSGGCSTCGGEGIEEIRYFYLLFCASDRILNLKRNCNFGDLPINDCADGQNFLAESHYCSAGLTGKRALEAAVAAPASKKSKAEKKVVPPPKKVESSSSEEDESDEQEVCMFC